LTNTFRGDTIGKRWRFYDENNARVDPDTIIIAIKNTLGVTMDTLDEDDLTRESVGVFKMLWNVPVDAAVGSWYFVVTATRTVGNIVNTKPFVFKVIA
jgi:hypothetical protein